jgi:hypothetical protein
MDSHVNAIEVRFKYFCSMIFFISYSEYALATGDIDAIYNAIFMYTAFLMGLIPSNEEIASFTGDGAYDTQDVHKACYLRGAIPIIPPRKGAKLRKGLAFAHRNEAVKACRRLGRAIWKRWSGYHRRSLVETKMNCFKRLGEKVMARTFERQVAELNIRASILNQFTALGTPHTVAAA